MRVSIPFDNFVTEVPVKAYERFYFRDLEAIRNSQMNNTRPTTIVRVIITFTGGHAEGIIGYHDDLGYFDTQHNWLALPCPPYCDKSELINRSTREGYHGDEWFTFEEAIARYFS
ncbi:MAG: hypothetical protein JNK77_02625 [Saprospiraceae bacterium]|nr:hypothetical protein [Saprospiraceae bacterium]